MPGRLSDFPDVTLEQAHAAALAVFLALACVGFAACTTSASAGGDRVRVVKSKADVASCRDLGKVHVEGPVYTAAGGFIGAAGDRAVVRKNKTAELGGNTLLRLGEDDDEAYDCPGYPSNAAHVVTLTGPGPDSGEKTTPARVLLVPWTQTSSLAGCTYVGFLKTSIVCPSGQDVETCTAFRATQDDGNAVLEGPPPRVYRCPEDKIGPTTVSVVSSASVRVVSSEDELKGCVYVDGVDTTIACPPEYPEGASCAAYRARRQDGNAVLMQGSGKVYRCPAR